MTTTKTLPASPTPRDSQAKFAGGERTAHAIAAAIVRASTHTEPAAIAEELRTAELPAEQRAAIDVLAYQAFTYKLVSLGRAPMPSGGGVTPGKGRHPGPQVAAAWNRWLEQLDIAADGRAIRIGDFTRDDVRASIERRLAMVAGLQSEIAERRLIEDAFASHPKAKRVRDLPRSVLSRVAEVAA